MLLADEEAAFLLPHLAAETLLEITQLQLVEDPAHLDRECRFLIGAVESVSD